jgi:hypothetical protein
MVFMNYGHHNKVNCEICSKEFIVTNGKYVFKIRKNSNGISSLHYSCGYNCFTKLKIKYPTYLKKGLPV